MIGRRVFVSILLVFACAGIGRAQTPSVALDVAAAPAGGPITITVAGGPANAGDWVGLYDADGNATQWQYLDGSHSLPASGATGATLTFMLPTTPGTYHACFFDARYTLIATSGAVTTTPSTITLGRSIGNPGVQVSAVVANAPGWPGDWAGLYDADDTNIEWQYLDGSHALPGSSIRDTTLTFTTPLVPGVYHARLFNAAYQEVAASGTITTINPSIMLGATTGTAGGQVTAIVANAPGLPGDFAGLYDANGVNLGWQYLNGTQTLPASGRTSATLTFSLPGTPGTYSARLFKGDYTQVATSAPITTTAPTVALTATTGVAGGPLAAIVTNGPGRPGDWAGVYNGAGQNFGWMYLNGSHEMPAAAVTSATLTFMLPVTPDVFKVRLFNEEYVPVATSNAITTAPPANVATVRFNAVTAAEGGLVTVTVTNAPGWPGDFVAVYDANNAIVAWQYLNGSNQHPPAAALHDATLTFVLPAMPGSYQARLMNALFEAVASSAAITVTRPTITSSSTTTGQGTSVSVKVGNAPGTPNDWVGLFDKAGTLVQWQHLNGSHLAPLVGLTSATLSFKLPPTSFFYTDLPVSWLGYASAYLVPPLSLTDYTAKLFNGTNLLVGTSDTATASLTCTSASATTTSSSYPSRVKAVTQCLRTSTSFSSLTRCLCQ